MKTYSPIAVLTGRASGLTEPRRIGYGSTEGATTRGHRADQGGLRGHSVGDTYPWRVIGYGPGWAVEGPDGIAAQYQGPGSCATAHAKARGLKASHPDGHLY